MHQNDAFSDTRQPSAFADLGPTILPLGDMRRIANEAQQLVLILLDTTLAGSRGDPARAARTLDRLRALVGPGQHLGD